MLIPRFSIRWLLVTTAGFALLSLAISYALRGSPVAAGIAVGVISLLALLLVYGLVFGILWLITGSQWKETAEPGRPLWSGDGQASVTGQPSRGEGLSG